MNLWVAVQTNVTLAYNQGGITLKEIANAVADNLDVHELRVLIHALEAEIEDKMESESKII